MSNNRAMIIAKIEPLLQMGLTRPTPTAKYLFYIELYLKLHSYLRNWNVFSEEREALASEIGLFLADATRIGQNEAQGSAQAARATPQGAAEADVQALAERIRELESKLEELELRNAELDKQYKADKGKMAFLERSNGELSEQLAKSKAEAAQRNAHPAREANRAISPDSILLDRSKFREHIANHNRLLNQNEQFAAKIHELNQTILAQSGLVSSLEQQLTSYHRDLREKSEQCNRLQAELESLRLTRAQAEEVIDVAVQVGNQLAMAPAQAQIKPKDEAQRNESGEVQTLAQAVAAAMQWNEAQSPEQKKARFFLLPRHAPLLDGSLDNFRLALANALKLEAMESHVSASDYRNAPGIAKLLAAHRKNIEELARESQARIAANDSDADELSEMYFKALERTFLNKMIGTIYRGLKGAPQFYEPLLPLVNDYLRDCGFYTREVRPGGMIQDEDFDDMEILVKNVPESGQDGIINEVAAPPYYLDYIREDGSQDSFCHLGSLVLNKFAGNMES